VVAWISITLGPDDTGTGSTLSPFTLALSIDSSGSLSAEATSTVAEIITVYFLAGAAGGAAPAFADVLLGTLDSSGPPFTGDTLAAMAEGEIRTVGAIGEDALGNRTVLVLASITRPTDSGSGAGTPGNLSLTLISGPPVVVRNVGATLREARGLQIARKFWNTTTMPNARLTHVCHAGASAGTELHWAYFDLTADPGALAPLESGVFVRADRPKLPEPGDFLPLVSAARGDNILFTLATKGGDGTSTLKTSDAFVDTLSADIPPAPPADDAPPEMPTGGALGNLILDLDVYGDLMTALAYADGASVTSWPDETAITGDAAPYTSGFTQSAPTFHTSGFAGGTLPCVRVSSGVQGVAFPIPTVGSCTFIMAVGAISGDGSPSDGAAPTGAFLLTTASANQQNGFVQVAGDGTTFTGVNIGSFGSPSHRGTTDVSGPTAIHIIRLSIDKVNARFHLFIDGVLEVEDGPYAILTNSWAGLARMYAGNVSGATGLQVDYGRILCYDAPQNTAGLNAAELLLQSIFVDETIPGGGGSEEPPPPPVLPATGGFGVDTPAGRGGSVIRVTTLADSGAGSLRAALTSAGVRTIVFEVSGTIALSSKIVVNNPFVTVAGQSAPSPGILIRNYGISVRTHDVLIQHLRIRVGDSSSAGNNDASETLGPAYNVVWDRCSLSWSTDENFSTWFTGTGDGAHDITISNCILSENMGSGAALIGQYSSRVAIVGCLFVNNDDRNAYFKGLSSGVFVNNLVYNWGQNPGTYLADPDGLGPTFASFVGNWYRPGPNTTNVRMQFYATCATGSLLYVDDNSATNANGGLPPVDPWTLVNNAFGVAGKAVSPPVWPDGLTPIANADVHDSVLTYAGAWASARDSVDTRVVADVDAGTGQLLASETFPGGVSLASVGGFPTIAANTRTMETAGMPADPNGDDDADGYTNLEEWLQGLSDDAAGL
jgi:hypothetical protein